ncbi:MAG: DNA-formamidopyrimidine glycosylase [Spirosomaceae bacterium]|jgi:formamidopyrimidine-DNA glycosylase|nr:DNA-formamidopyrimidine glycosylase [Spirosomataceae bacterium]
MPELPEVETYRRYFEATSLHQPLDFLEVEDHKLLTTDYATLTETLIGQAFVGTERVGKNLFAFTDGGATLHLHFGMTGDLEYYHSSLTRPRHARIVFGFRSGFCLGFICPRKFERIGLVESVASYLQKKKIAPDGLQISLVQLTKNLQKRKALIKPTLLDQSTVAGIGNWIADEVLFQAKIHPEQPCNTLTDSQFLVLHQAIRHVLQTAIEHEANYDFFPKDFIIHAREWGESPYSVPDRHLDCPCGKVRIAQSRVGGRATYFCPMCQLLP